MPQPVSTAGRSGRPDLARPTQGLVFPKQKKLKPGFMRHRICKRVKNT